MAENWSEHEVQAAVEDYFNMLRLELTGQKFNKTEHRRTLLKRLKKRSHGSIELKHQNISAVLIEMGIPYIDGYKPRSNYQRSLLPNVITDFLVNYPEFQTLFQEDSQMVPAIPTVEDFLAAMESPPKREEKTNSVGVAEHSKIFNPVGVNYLEKESRNQSLGNAGEQFVINFERARLIHAGKGFLSERVEQISVTKGPSAGFDILSFEKNGTDRYIEAKTTKYGKNTPFFITPNELTFSQKNASRYHLYRIFKFRETPRLFSLQGYLEDHCVLNPSQFLAKPA
ncbi:DUF3883 domain-containing protein [Desulfotignum phosphitoxidans]|uniref:Protein NO VEIN C-terminal domain-containing protein n=1 Tax=Desulfotignum phosphitoxidans DSM 13687 TaxID=1286635 RepID=S0G6C4_9BACT|nr:DUF3883 domain-containing protein [Desulfotignum phosphitoxidans]EMS80262.1 hypothetical protein Dpo_3c04070 [Desulfotignum phosphitoxidans DSM 13687]